MQAATHQATIIMEIPLEYLYADPADHGDHDVHSHAHDHAPGLAGHLAERKRCKAGVTYSDHPFPTETRQNYGYSHLIIILGSSWEAWLHVVPIGMCLFFTAVVGFLVFTNLPLLMLAQSLFRSMDNFALVVVLYFILCGNIMTAGKIVDKLIKFSHTLVSWLPGGLAMAGCLGCGTVRRDLGVHRGHRGGPRRIHDPRPDEEQVS